MKKNSDYLKGAELRIKNRKWLKYSSNIARRILAAMEDIDGMNQSKLADRINVTKQYISKVVSGKENLTLETIAKISDALNTELIEFPYYKDDNPIVLKSTTNYVTIPVTEMLDTSQYQFDKIIIRKISKFSTETWNEKTASNAEGSFLVKNNFIKRKDLQPSTY